MARITESRCRYHICKELQSYIESHTLREILDFIKTHGTIEEDDDEVACFIPAHEHDFVEGKTYDMGKHFHYDEFVITTDGRLFFTPTLLNNIEILDDEEDSAMTINDLAKMIAEELNTAVKDAECENFKEMRRLYDWDAEDIRNEIDYMVNHSDYGIAMLDDGHVVNLGNSKDDDNWSSYGQFKKMVFAGVK